MCMSTSVYTRGLTAVAWQRLGPFDWPIPSPVAGLGAIGIPRGSHE